MIGEYPIAVVVKENEHQWVVRCPYCRKRHYHGIGEGNRVAHCLVKDENNIGYDVRLPTSEGVAACQIVAESEALQVQPCSYDTAK